MTCKGRLLSFKILLSRSQVTITRAEEALGDIMADERNAPMVTLHMVSSLDGFIARRDNSVSWLEDCGGVYEAGASISAEEVEAFIKSVDCYVMGSHTYEHALELGWPYGETPCLVLTSRQLETSMARVEFHHGDLGEFVGTKVVPRFRNVWLVGGAMLSQQFLRLGLVAEIRLTVAPALLGDGIRFFGDLEKEQTWALKNVTAYKNGFVELHYAASAR